MPDLLLHVMPDLIGHLSKKHNYWLQIGVVLIIFATKEKNYGTDSIYSPDGRGRQKTIRRTLQRLWHEQQHRLQHVRPCRHQE